MSAAAEQATESRSEPRATVELGILADPDLPAEIARELADELPEVLARPCGPTAGPWWPTRALPTASR